LSARRAVAPSMVLDIACRCVPGGTRVVVAGARRLTAELTALPVGREKLTTKKAGADRPRPSDGARGRRGRVKVSGRDCGVRTAGAPQKAIGGVRYRSVRARMQKTTILPTSRLVVKGIVFA